MNHTKIFPNVRSPLTSKVDHSVVDLLREVAEVSGSLTDEERREVTEMAKRVKEHQARKTPMGKLKKKIADNIDSINNAAKISPSDGRDDNSTIKSSSHGHGNETKTPNGAGSGPVNTWGKDLFQKIENKIAETDQQLQKDRAKWKQESKEAFQKFSLKAGIQNPLKKDDQQQQKDPTTTTTTFQKFSLKGIQNPLKSPQQAAATPTSGEKGEKDKRPEIMKAFERSSESARDSLQKFSKNFQNSLSLPPLNPTTSAAATASNSSRPSGDAKPLSFKAFFKET